MGWGYNLLVYVVEGSGFHPQQDINTHTASHTITHTHTENTGNKNNCMYEEAWLTIELN